MEVDPFLIIEQCLNIIKLCRSTYPSSGPLDETTQGTYKAEQTAARVLVSALPALAKVGAILDQANREEKGEEDGEE